MPIFTGIAAGIAALEAASTAALASTSAAVTSAAAAGGLGAGAGVGLTAAETAAAVASGGAAAAPWAAGTTIAAAAGSGGLGTLATAAGGVGTALSLGAQGMQMYEGQQATSEQQRQEALRQKQMQLDAARQRREVIRQTQISQATGINNAANSGGAIDSSVLSGIVGQNTTNSGYALNNINENEAIGNSLFQSNAAEAGYQGSSTLFGGVSKLGQSISQNNMPIARLGTTLFNNVFNG